MLQVDDKFITVRAETAIVSRNQGSVMHNCNENPIFCDRPADFKIFVTVL